MSQRIQWKLAIREDNMHVQVNRKFMYEVPPISTNVGEFAPPKLVIPTFFILQSVLIEYFE